MYRSTFQYTAVKALEELRAMGVDPSLVTAARAGGPVLIRALYLYVIVEDDLAMENAQ